MSTTKSPNHWKVQGTGRVHCSACQTAISLRGVQPLTRQSCPKCGEAFWVPCYLGDRYLLNKPLGKGRTSLVCSGYDTVMDRLVAVKLVRSDTGDQSAAWKHAQIEGTLLARINHTNVVQTYLLSDNRDQPFIVMEFVNGLDVRRAVREHGLISPLRAVHLLHGAVSGLRAAHEVGLMHRDLDPGNLMVTSSGVAKLIDFGRSAELQVGASGDDVTHEQVGFLSPEALLGMQMDLRSDLYALGATLFYALTGKVPMPRERSKRLAYDPWRLRPTYARKVRPDVPGLLADTLDWMMKPMPDGRPSTHRRLLSHLEQIEPIIAQDQTLSSAA